MHQLHCASLKGQTDHIQNKLTHSSADGEAAVKGIWGGSDCELSILLIISVLALNFKLCRELVKNTKLFI